MRFDHCSTRYVCAFKQLINVPSQRPHRWHTFRVFSCEPLFNKVSWVPSFCTRKTIKVMVMLPRHINHTDSFINFLKFQCGFAPKSFLCTPHTIIFRVVNRAADFDLFKLYLSGGIGIDSFKVKSKNLLLNSYSNLFSNYFGN